MSNRPVYPVFIPSKGRFQPERALTVKTLLEDPEPIRFRLAVEPQEAEQYAELVGEDRLLILPFSNLGQGSIPARNWIRDHAEGEGHRKHFQLDDNIIEFRRLWKGRRIPCDAGSALKVMEDFADRYSNLAITGLNYQMFVPAETSVPFYRNVHAYSCVLIDHAMPYRHRGRYNEDTDLCLQALAGGWCTVLINAFVANKIKTMALGGGNTDELYAGDGRFRMAEELVQAWPDVVHVTRRFGRPQHRVDWTKFTTPLQRA